jgi:hypothetical protein
MFDIDASWNPARVVGVWAEAEIPSGKRSVSYDIEGKDEDGPFWGRFTADHVRAAVLVGRSEPHAQTESRPEAKP